jgi:hypothetical protein
MKPHKAVAILFMVVFNVRKIPLNKGLGSPYLPHSAVTILGCLQWWEDSLQQIHYTQNQTLYYHFDVMGHKCVQMFSVEVRG